MDMRTVAHNVAVERGFDPDFGPDVMQEVRRVTSAGAPGMSANVRDLRALPWSSIDNDESKDLDQVEVAEALPNGAIRLMVGIADVDAVVPRGSAIDRHAYANATSLYTGAVVFPMLPRELSEDLTSLLPERDRLAVVVEQVVEAGGAIASFEVYRALVRNSAKLVYETVGAWLEKRPGAEQKLPAAMIPQLTLQREVATRLKEERLRAGALELDTIEARPVTRDGRIVDLAVIQKSLARDLIEDFMIATNVATARFLESHGSSGIRRVVRAPERWSRIVDLARQHGQTLPPEPDSRALAGFLARMRAADPLRFPDLSLSVVKLLGRGEYKLDLPGKDPGIHFGLAAHDYSHATAPNRRYADLIQQRLVKAVLAGAPQPYTNDELAEIAAHVTEREDASQKVERQMRKMVAAGFLQSKIGATFDAIVTGVSKKGTFVRLLHPPAEGRVTQNESGLDVGDRVRVTLLQADQERGFLDFRATAAAA